MTIPAGLQGSFAKTERETNHGRISLYNKMLYDVSGFLIDEFRKIVSCERSIRVSLLCK